MFAHTNIEQNGMSNTKADLTIFMWHWATTLASERPAVKKVSRYCHRWQGWRPQATNYSKGYTTGENTCRNLTDLADDCITCDKPTNITSDITSSISTMHINECTIRYFRFQVFTTVWLMNPFFCDMTIHHWVIGFRRLEGRYRLYLQASKVARTNVWNALRYFERSGTDYQMTQRHLPEKKSWRGSSTIHINRNITQHKSVHSLDAI